MNFIRQRNQTGLPVNRFQVLDVSHGCACGCVASHSMRAAPVGSSPRFSHHHGFITVTMQLPMMSSAQRHRELVADLATECTRLREAQMVRIARPSAADQARLLDHMPDMIAVSYATRLGEDKNTFVHLNCRAGLLGRALLKA